MFWLYQVSSESFFSPSEIKLSLVERWEQYIRDTKISSILRIFQRPYMFASLIYKKNFFLSYALWAVTLLSVIFFLVMSNMFLNFQNMGKYSLYHSS